MPTAQTDFLILGQGLAGSILAYCLIKAGYSVRVLDNKHHASSSTVAAGIINPITGHRLNISEGFSNYYPLAESFYREVEQTLNCELFQVTSQTRLIKNAGQHEYLTKRLNDENYKGLIEPVESEKLHDQGYGAIRVNSTAVVDVGTLLKKTRDWLSLHDGIESVRINYDDIKLDDEGVKVQQWRAKHIVFCEGHQAIDNPWLKNLPFKLSKGEVLTLKPTNTQAPELLNWGNWLASSTKKTRLGSSYEWNKLSLEPSLEVRQKLLDSMQKFTSMQASVLSHHVGIRPTTLHRIPFIGRLSRQPKLLCFNGFGSKGCLTIPYFAKLFLAHVTDQSELPSELNKWL